MCTPALALGGIALGASVGGSLMQYQQASAYADAQSQYQKFIYDQNKEIVQQSLIQEYEATLVRQTEEQTKANQEIFEITRQAREAAARSYTQSVESGVAGLSVDSLLNDIVRRESEFVFRTQEQQRMVQLQLQREKQGLAARAQGQIISRTPEPISRPSALATGLNIVGATAGFFGSQAPTAGSTYFDAIFSG